MKQNRKPAMAQARLSKVCNAYYIIIPRCAALPEGAEFILDELTGVSQRNVSYMARYIGRAIKAYRPKVKGK